MLAQLKLSAFCLPFCKLRITTALPYEGAVEPQWIDMCKVFGTACGTLSAQKALAFITISTLKHHCFDTHYLIESSLQPYKQLAWSPTITKSYAPDTNQGLIPKSVSFLIIHILEELIKKQFPESHLTAQILIPVHKEYRNLPFKRASCF